MSKILMDTLLCVYTYTLVICIFQSNAHGESRRAPVFNPEPPGHVAFSNSSGTAISCGADGRPPPRIKWLRADGGPLLELPSLRYTRHDGTLVFPPFAGDEYRADVHAAVYRCHAENSIGTAGSRDVHVTAVVLQKYEIRLFDEIVLRGNMAVIRCLIPSFASDYVRVISWERIDGFQITPGIISAKYGMLESGDLYIRDTLEYDGSYSFRCHTENTVTKEKRVSMNYSKVIVTEPNHNQPPRITRRVSRVSASVGYRATLPCVAQAFPVPTFRWRRGTQALPDHTISVSQEGGVLIFHKVVPSDAGRYVCHVTNVVGEDTVDVDLVVEDALRVAVSPTELRLEVGRTATFNCSVAGGGKGARVTWRKDMSSPGPRALFPGPHILQLRQLRRQDAGVYQCFVHTDTHSEQSTAVLTIGDMAPTLKQTFPEKIIRPGRYVSLTCIATGHPEPVVRWTLDNQWPLATRPGFLVTSYGTNSGDVISYVNITSADVTDSGLYACDARNDAGSVSHERRLNVFGPVFVRALSNLTALAGEEFRTTCPYGGYPFEAVVWKRDERILPVNQRQRVFSNGSLIIEGMQRGVDDGLYTCEVRQTPDSQPVARAFRVIIRTKPQVSKFAFQDNLHEGMRTAVTCVVIAGDGPLTTKWTKDDQPLDERDLDVILIPAEEGFVSTLTVRALGHRHNGNYTCIATNDVASATFSATLTVKVPPRWVLEPSDTSAVAGRSAIIDCQAQGVPQPHVRWKVATEDPPDRFETIISSSHVHILVNGSLNFRSIETADAGLYLCEANNGVGQPLSTVVKLTVHSAPQFQSKFTVLSTRRGEKTVLNCRPTGDASVRFTWRRNGQIVDTATETRYSLNVESESENILASLILEKAERRDSALFTCTATNDFGEDTLSIQLTVKDIPDAPQNMEVHDVSSRSVRLTWDRPFDGNSPISQYTVVWRRTEEESSGGPLTVHGSERSVTVRGLRPKTRYFFRVKCLNALGESQFGAEVAATTLQEPPRLPPREVKTSALSSRSINVSWEIQSETEGESSGVEGFYVGYRTSGSAEPYTFVPVEGHHFQLNHLHRSTEYSVIVQAYNKRGAGPPSEPATVTTLEFDRPSPPIIRNYYSTSTSIKITWEYSSSINAPITGFVVHHRTDGTPWMETPVVGERTNYTLQDLLCGTKYYCFLVATNAAGRGNSSEVVATKTAGSAPLAPDKRLLIQVNSSSVAVNLNSWHNGGCAIRFFVLQYKVVGHQAWTLVSNNVIPERQVVTLTDLVPGTWYSLLMTARNDAGATDAEYVFATLTLSGEYPPRPSEISNSAAPFYRHLTITVPVVSSVIVLVLVICVVCVVTKRRSTDCRFRTPDGADGSETVKQHQHENIPLSGTYEGVQEPVYFPTPYATSRVNGRENPHHAQNTGTFGSTRSGYTYNIPCPPRRTEKEESIYETSAIYFSTYQPTGIELRNHQELPIYEVPDRGRMILNDGKFWRDGNSSTESDTDDLLFSLHSADVIREEARESETECDRLWKTREVSHYHQTSRWTEEILVS